MRCRSGDGQRLSWRSEREKWGTGREKNISGKICNRHGVIVFDKRPHQLRMFTSFMFGMHAEVVLITSTLNAVKPQSG